MIKSVKNHIPKKGEIARMFKIGVDTHIETNAVNEDGEHVPSGIRHEGYIKAGVKYWICEGK